MRIAQETLFDRGHLWDRSLQRAGHALGLLTA
jgi:hypothetical protein